MAAEPPFSTYHTRNSSSYNESHNTKSHTQSASISSVASSVYSVHHATTFTSPVESSSHPYNTLVSGGSAAALASSPNHSRNISTIAIPPKSSLRLLNTLHSSLVQDEIQEVSDQDEEYTQHFIESSLAVARAPHHYSVNSTASTNSTAQSLYQSLDLSNDSNVTEHPEDYYSPVSSNHNSINYTYDQLTIQQLSFVQDFIPSHHQQQLFRLRSAKRQVSQKSQDSTRFKYSSRMSRNMEELVRSFEQELSALDGFGEVLLDNTSDQSDSEDTANLSIVTSKKSLEPSAMPYSGQNHQSSSNPSASPESLGSSVENFSPRTPKTPKYPLHSQEQLATLKRKPSVMGKFRTFGKRIISGGQQQSHIQSSPADSPNAKFSTPPIGSADGFGSPGHVQAMKTPLITMKFSSERKNSAH